MNNPTLLGQVRRKLNITWDDDDTTARIEEIIESAIPTMLHKLGIADPDFEGYCHCMLYYKSKD